MKASRNALFAALVVGGIGALSYVAPLVAQSGQQMGFFFGDTFAGSLKHWAAGSAAPPIITLCGTTPTVTASSGDTAGQITTGTGGTGCVITFGRAFVAAPTCLVLTGSSATKPTYISSTTALHLNTSISATLYDYICIAKGAG